MSHNDQVYPERTKSPQYCDDSLLLLPLPLPPSSIQHFRARGSFGKAARRNQYLDDPFLVAYKKCTGGDEKNSFTGGGNKLGTYKGKSGVITGTEVNKSTGLLLLGFKSSLSCKCKYSCLVDGENLRRVIPVPKQDKRGSRPVILTGARIERAKRKDYSV